MNYVIKNGKGAYLKLNEQGAVVRCSREDRQEFDEQKAKNIVESLPKLFQSMNFKISPADKEQVPIRPDLSSHKAVVEIPDLGKKQDNVLISEDYETSEDVTRWIDKFGTCYETIEEALNRIKQLNTELNNVDKQFIDIIHKIELTKHKDLYGGWLLYKEVKENRHRRRDIKDELLILTSITSNLPDLHSLKELNRDNVERHVGGLASRKYKLRIQEE